MSISYAIFSTCSRVLLLVLIESLVEFVSVEFSVGQNGFILGYGCFSKHNTASRSHSHIFCPQFELSKNENSACYLIYLFYQ